LKEVMQRVGLSKPGIYKLIRKGKFPKQLHLTGRCVGWRECDIDDWIENLPTENPEGSATVAKARTSRAAKKKAA